MDRRATQLDAIREAPSPQDADSVPPGAGAEVIEPPRREGETDSEQDVSQWGSRTDSMWTTDAPDPKSGSTQPVPCRWLASRDYRLACMSGFDPGQTGRGAEAPRVTAKSGGGRASAVLTAGAVGELRVLASRFTDRDAVEKMSLLAACSKSTIEDVRVLLAYHDCLLFLLAYPQTPELRAMAGQELDRVAREARRLAQRGERNRWLLEDSGVAWSETRPVLSYPIVRWLVERQPHHADLAFFADDGSPLWTVLKLCMPEIEETVLSRAPRSEELLDELTRRVEGSRLQWLVAQLARLPCSEEIREHLFQSLRAYVLIRPRDGPLSRTFARGLPSEPFYHEAALIRSVDLQAVVTAPLPPPRRLSAEDRLHLIDTARAVLTILGRETEAISSCAPDGVEYLDLGRGISLALYAMPPGRRPPIDTHLGFMLFKNTMPIAYGGGWPFLGLCRVGIHIFEPYRGGESASAFCQVLRVYHQRFAARRFLVEATQFGEGEPEGLASGAFWFYYRLGFRPVDRRLAKVAEAEVERLAVDGDHRTPVGVLRRLTHSDLELALPGGDAPTARCDPADLSLAVTRWIGTYFGGDRTAGERAAVKMVSGALGVTGLEGWPEAERRSFRSLCLLLAMIPELDRWPAADRRKAIAIMRAKGMANERPYFDLIRRHRRFCEALVELASAAKPSVSPPSRQ